MGNSPTRNCQCGEMATIWLEFKGPRINVEHIFHYHQEFKNMTGLECGCSMRNGRIMIHTELCKTCYSKFPVCNNNLWQLNKKLTQAEGFVYK